MTKFKVDRRSQLRAAYLYIVDEWAPEASEVQDYLTREGYFMKLNMNDKKFNKKQTRSLLTTLRRKNLVVDHVVNGEGPAVWQSYYSIQDGDDRSKAETDFDLAFPEGEEIKTGSGSGAYGRRYTEEQLNEAAKLRGKGELWVTIGEKLGIKATAHLAKTLRARDARITNEVAQDLGKAIRKPAAKKVRKPAKKA